MCDDLELFLIELQEIIGDDYPIYAKCLDEKDSEKTLH